MLIVEQSSQDQIVVFQVYHVKVSIIVGSLVLEATLVLKLALEREP